MKHLLADGENKMEGVGPIIDRKGTYEVTIKWVRLSSLGGSILHRWGHSVPCTRTGGVITGTRPRKGER